MIDPKHLLTPSEVGQRLRRLREQFGLTGVYVASTCGIDQSNYSKIEKGDVNLSVAAALALCEIYGVDLDYIYRGDPTNGPRPLDKR